MFFFCRYLLLIRRLKDVRVLGWSLNLPVRSAGSWYAVQMGKQGCGSWVLAEVHHLPLTWLQTRMRSEHSFPHPMHLFFPMLWAWIWLEHWLAFPGLVEESPGGTKQCLPLGQFRCCLQKSCDIRNESLWQPLNMSKHTTDAVHATSALSFPKHY